MYNMAKFISQDLYFDMTCRINHTYLIHGTITKCCLGFSLAKAMGLPPPPERFMRIYQKPPMSSTVSSSGSMVVQQTIRSLRNMGLIAVNGLKVRYVRLVWLCDM